MYKRHTSERCKTFDTKKEMIEEFNAVRKEKPYYVREIVAGKFDIVSAPCRLIQFYDIWVNGQVALDEVTDRIESWIVRKPPKDILIRTVGSNHPIDKSDHKPDQPCVGYDTAK